jgi:hypothetical protein
MIKGLQRFKEIFLYSDSEPNEVLIGLLHFLILPFAMFELGQPYLVLQIIASFVGAFQLYAVLFNGSLKVRLWAVQMASMIALGTVINYALAGMLKGSNFGWLLILVFATWNLIRVTREKFTRK